MNPMKPPKALFTLIRQLPLLPAALLSGALSAALAGALAALSDSASAMPGAPMRRLADFSPGCEPDPRRVVLHDAAGPLHPNDLPDHAELVRLVIDHFARTGELARREGIVRRTVLGAADAPLEGPALPRAPESSLRRIDSPPAVREAFGNLRRGEAAGFLDDAALPGSAGHALSSLLLIDGADAAQRAWALLELARRRAGETSGPEPRIVVAAGSARRVREDAARDPSIRVWLDQGGTIRRRLALASLPARVTTTPEAILVETTGEALLPECARNDDECVAKTLDAFVRNIAPKRNDWPPPKKQ